MDKYLQLLITELEKINRGEINPDPLNFAILCKEGLKYNPNNTTLLNQLGALLYNWGIIGESYQLLVRSYSIDQNENSKHKLKMFDDLDYPEIITIEVSTICNLKCPICPTGTGLLKRQGKLMKFDDFRIIWNKVKDTTKKLIIVGQGETFLNKDIYRMLDYIKDSTSHYRDTQGNLKNEPLWTYIDTNGNIPVDYKKLLECNLDEIVFSIDGINQETYEQYRINGNFQTAVQNLKELVEARTIMRLKKPRIVYKYIVFKHTEMHIESARSLALSLGVDDFRIEPSTFKTDYGIDVFRKYVSNSPEFQRIESIDFDNNRIMPNPNHYSRHCTITHNNLYITVNGDVAPCCGVDQNDMPLYGNLLTQSLEKVWNSKEAKLFRRQVLKDRHSHTACNNCSFPMLNFGKFLDDIEFNSCKPQYKSQSKIKIHDNSISD